MPATILVLVIIVIMVANLALLIHVLAEYNVFFTKVPEGEIITITHSGKVHRFIGNIKGFWVNPETGEVFEEKTPPTTVKLPSDLFGTGIYWLGFWPFAERYEYMFHWNKYAKRKDGGKETSEYELIPREEVVSSIYFRAAYAVRISGGETKENVPVTLDLLITTETVNVNTALFKVKSPGWIAALTGAATAVGRDFIGNKTVNQLVRLKSEIPKSSVSGKNKTDLQIVFDELNKSDLGNPGIIEQFGEKITAVNFLGITIDQAQTETHKIAISKYNAERIAEAKIVEEKGKADAAIETAKGTRVTADAEAYKIEKEGTAIADAATKLAKAVSSNPHASAIAIAEAIKNQTAATTLVLGPGVVPTKAI